MHARLIRREFRKPAGHRMLSTGSVRCSPDPCAERVAKRPSSGDSSGNESDDEKVAAIAIEASSPSSSPPSTSSTHLRVTERYKVRMRVVKVIVSMNHLLMMNL